MEKTVRVQMFLKESTLEKLDQLAEQYAIGNNRTAAIGIAVTIAHKKEFPDYIQVSKQRTPGNLAEREAAKEDARQTIKEKRERDEASAICNLLDGSSVVTIEGRDYCEYPLYNMSSPRKVDITTAREPFSTITDGIVSAQYHDIIGNNGELAKKTIKKLLLRLSA